MGEMTTAETKEAEFALSSRREEFDLTRRRGNQFEKERKQQRKLDGWG